MITAQGTWLAGRQADEAVRTRLDWQYLLELGRADPGIDHSVLSEFRSRLLNISWKRRCWTRCWRSWPRTAW